jgi:hypothetical protein
LVLYNFVFIVSLWHFVCSESSLIPSVLVCGN